MSKRRVPSAITRVKTSSRPVELFGFAAATISGGSARLSKQRHDVDAVGLQHRAVGEAELVQLQLVDALGDGGAGTRQEARANAIGDVAEAKVEARRLDLAFDEIVCGQDEPRFRHRRDHAVGQDTIGVGSDRERQTGVLVRGQMYPDMRKIRAFYGYPMDALTKRALRNMSITYPVVI